MSLTDKLDLIEIGDLLCKRSTPRRISGIYFLFRKDKLVYVGQSTNVIARVHSHTVRFDTYTYIEVDHEIDFLEMAYITKYRPSENRLRGENIREESRLRRSRSVP